MLARSNVVLEGYWQQPEESARALAGDWFHTGDGGVIGDDGYLTISDRKKDVIITGGENVSSIEVEDVLFSHPAVAEVAVIGVPSEKWGETIKALVVLAEGEQATEAELIAWCKDKAAGYKAPTSIEFRDELARTATGKLQKFKLRAPYWEGRDRQVQLISTGSIGGGTTTLGPCRAEGRRRPAARVVPARHRRRLGRGRAGARRPRGAGDPRCCSRSTRPPRSRRRPPRGGPTCWSCTTRCSSSRCTASPPPRRRAARSPPWPAPAARC